MISIKFYEQPMPPVKPPKPSEEPIISASEARKIAQKVIDERSDKLLQEVLDIIRCAAKRGEFYIDDVDYNLVINSNVMCRLENLGYKVNLKMDGVYAYIRVSWE